VCPIKGLEGSVAESNIGELKVRHIDKVPTLTKALRAFVQRLENSRPIAITV